LTVADAPTFGSELLQAVPLVIGTVIGFAGSAWTQWYQHELKAADDRRSRLADKLEQMIAAIYEHEHWLDEMGNARVFGTGTTDPFGPRLSPLTKVQTLCTIYFPQFEDAVANLDVAARAYEQWMIAAAMKRFKNEPNHNAGFEQAYQPYLNSRVAAIKAIRAFAQREFGEGDASRINALLRPHRT
jgi:hypothetical protein